VVVDGFGVVTQASLYGQKTQNRVGAALSIEKACRQRFLKQNIRTVKKELMILSSMLVAVGAFAQGQVNFAARVEGLYDAPVFVNFVIGGAKAEGPAFMVQLYAGATASKLAPIGAPLPFSTRADGYWKATTETINTVDGNGNAFVQVRAWPTFAGATYEAALAAFPLAGSWGRSALLTVKPTQPPDGPAPLTGLTSFAIDVPLDLPEPSIVALGALGGLALLLGRRK
jgi:hypothetical protein